MSAAAASRPVTVPEHALRPRAQPGPGVELSRAARLYVDGDALVLRGRSRTRRVPLGGRGVRRAVFVDVAAPDAERVGPAVAGSWGELQLQSEEGSLIARLCLDDWLPEADALPKRAVHGAQLLSRTGVAGLLDAAGIPLHTVTGLGDPRVAPPRPGLRRTGPRPVTLSPGNAFPAWYWALRLTAGLVWFTAFTVLLFSGALWPGLTLLAAGAALAAPLARLALRAWTRLRLRRTPPGEATWISPCPAPDVAATARFRRDTRLRIHAHDLVLTDLSGQEHWLPRQGPHAVRDLVLVRDRSGAPLGVELRCPDDQLRAVLPWAQWFAGGGQGWAELRRALGGEVSERRLTGRADWPKGPGPVLGEAFLPATAKEARAASRFPGTIAGLSSTIVMALASYLSVAQGIALAGTHPAFGRAVLLTGLCAALLQALPYVLHQLDSRARLDRPAREQVHPV